jgi:hypothetical protein
VNVGDRVHFSVRDVYLPEPAKLLLDLHADDEIEGHVTAFSDSGAEKRAYAVIEVDRVSQPISVFVPVNKLTAIPASTS